MFHSLAEAAKAKLQCGTCHYHDDRCCNCGRLGRPRPLAQAKPTTQKARGVKALAALGYNVPAARLVQTQRDMDALLDEVRSVPLFARPCPPTPRPGFVDSRICTTNVDYMKVWKEARKAEPHAEMLLMPPLSADYNIVICPGLMTIGPGHDGATAGHDAIGLPIVGTDPKLAEHYDDLDIAPGQVPHIEVVGKGTGGMYSQDIQWWTQCRSGPAHPGLGPDYVPADITAAAIVIPCDDFLQWETIVQAGFAPGTVVWGKGHTLGSHAALHCLAHGVPFITSHQPLLGEHLAATPALPPYDIKALRAGIGLAFSQPVPANTQTVRGVLYALHQAPALRGADSWWLGWAAGTMLRLGLQAAAGEGGCHDLSYAPTYTAWCSQLQTPLALRSAIRACMNHFFTDAYRPAIAGIGGLYWAWCSASLEPLADALMMACMPVPEADDVELRTQSLILALNLAINQAHNSGFWMNKFGSNINEFNDACAGKWQQWLMSAPALRDIHKRMANLTPAEHTAMASFIELWATTPSLPPFTPIMQTAAFTGDVYAVHMIYVTWQHREAKIKVHPYDTPGDPLYETKTIPLTFTTHHDDIAWRWQFYGPDGQVLRVQTPTMAGYVLLTLRPDGMLVLPRTRPPADLADTQI